MSSDPDYVSTFEIVSFRSKSISGGLRMLADYLDTNKMESSENIDIVQINHVGVGLPCIISAPCRCRIGMEFDDDRCKLKNFKVIYDEEE